MYAMDTAVHFEHRADDLVERRRSRREHRHASAPAALSGRTAHAGPADELPSDGPPADDDGR